MSAASATTSPLGEPHAEPEYVIPAPPPAEYPTAEAAEAAIHEWTLANRYNVTRNKQTRNDNGDVRYVLFACDHAGGPQNTRKLTDSGRQRKMSRSKRDGYKLLIIIVAVDSSNTAGPRKIAHTKDGSQVHNHPASSNVDDPANRLRYLLWALPVSTRLARDFMGILVIDCTYKTNENRMPVLNAMTLTGMNTILPVAQIWMSGEAEPDFLWALGKLNTLFEEQSILMPMFVVSDRDLACLNASEEVFPSANKLLCRWHIRRNVLAHAQCKRVVADVHGVVPAVLKSMKELQVEIFMARFDAKTINAATEADFAEGCRALQELSIEMDNYLQRTWWPYKTKFV